MSEPQDEKIDDAPEPTGQEEQATDSPDAHNEANRREFLSLSAVAMGISLAASYGTLGVMAGQFLYHSAPRRREWLFVAETKQLNVGATLRFQIPGGESVNVTRLADKGSADDFLALSSTCPHLGCQVHWEGQNNRFFCPCHNGVFTPDGKGIGGPPGDAGQSLDHYPLRIDNGLLFLEAPVAENA